VESAVRRGAIDPRAAAAVHDKLPKVRWDMLGGEKDEYSIEDCVYAALPMEFLLHKKGSLGWTHASLPRYVTAFSEYEYVQCLGVLLAQCLHDGPIHRVFSSACTGVRPGWG
jgi:hypothetical protein